MSEREPLFNAPRAVLVLLGLFATLHLTLYVLPEQESEWFTVALGYIPARWSGFAQALPGGRPAALTSLFTHVFVHGDLMHLIFNSAWLLAFGTPVARRSDSLRFMVFFLMAGAAGAVFYTLIHPGSMTVLIGASGAVSGLMGGAFRFLFPAFRDGEHEGLGQDRNQPPLASLAETLRDRRAQLAIVGWTILNILLAWGAEGLTESAGIAWEAHLGGFYAGLLAYGFFDRSPGLQRGPGNGADTG